VAAMLRREGKTQERSPLSWEKRLFCHQRSGVKEKTLGFVLLGLFQNEAKLRIPCFMAIGQTDFKAWNGIAIFDPTPHGVCQTKRALVGFWDESKPAIRRAQNLSLHEAVAPKVSIIFNSNSCHTISYNVVQHHTKAPLSISHKPSFTQTDSVVED
jgi:hypothetical protein